MKKELIYWTAGIIAGLILGYVIVANAGTVNPIFTGGTGTTTAPAGQLLYGGGAGVYQSEATGTITCTGAASCSTSGLSIIGGNLTISASGGSGAPYPFQGANNSTSTLTQFNAGLTAFASSTIGAGGVTTGLTINGTATTTNFINLNVASALGLFNAQNLETAYGGTSCTNQALTVLSATGSGTCSSINNAFWSGTQLSIGNGGTNETSFANSTNGLTYNGTGIISAPWTSPVDYPFASSTSITATSSLYANDTQNSWIAKVSPTHSLVFQTGTTTTWTGTTSLAYVPSTVAPFSGTLKQARCLASSTQAFLGVTIYINTTAITPSYFVASTTVGLEKFTANNTFNAGDTISAFFGTTTTDANAISISCTLDTTQS